MTRLLKQAIERLGTAPESEQDRLALFLLKELEEDDQRWAQSTAAQASDAIVAGSMSAAAATLPAEDFRDWEV